MHKPYCMRSACAAVTVLFAGLACAASGGVQAASPQVPQAGSQPAAADRARTASSPNGSPAGTAASAAGLSVRSVPDELRRNLAIEAGVLVQDTQGAAFRAGIRPGDIILSADNAPVTSVAQLESRMAESAGGTVVLLVRRGRDTHFMPLPLPPRQ